MAKWLSQIHRGRGGGFSLGLNRLNMKVFEVGMAICKNRLQLSDGLVPLKVLKERKQPKLELLHT